MSEALFPSLPPVRRGLIGPVYVVTDAESSLPVADQALGAARGGAWAVQLRDKHLSDADFAALAQALHPPLAAMGVRLFVNDRLEVACALGLDLHIGQGDTPAALARARLGAGALLGLSVEEPGQLAAIPPGTVDYLGVGPVRATSTKPDHAPAIGFAGLADIVRAAPCPVIAIGGLRAGDGALLQGAGAVGLAVVTAVTRAADPEAATRALLAEWSPR